MRRRQSLMATAALALAVATAHAASDATTTSTVGYKLEEGTVLEFQTSATFTSMREAKSESWQHKSTYTVLASRDGTYDLFVKITPQGASQRVEGQYACDTVQISADGKILKQGAVLPSGIFPGWSVNFELPPIYSETESMDYRDPVTMLPLQAKVTRTENGGKIIQKIVADPNSKALAQLPVKINVAEVENVFSKENGLPLATHARFAAEIQVSQSGEKREIAVESECKRLATSSISKDALAKLKEDVAQGATTFKALRDATTSEEPDTTAILEAIKGYLAKFPDGQYAPMLKELEKRVVSEVERARKWAAISEGKPAPEFATTTVDGKPIDLKKLRGKVVVLDFWATWCGPCRQLMPAMKELYDSFKDKDFALVGISADRSVDDLKEYVEKEEIAWPQIFEGDGDTTTVLAKYGVNKFPTIVVVDKQGVIRAVDVHPPKLNEVVEDLLKK